MAAQNLQTFTFEVTQIRTIYDDNGKPLFCLADVCKALDLQNPTHAANQIKEEFELPTLNVGSFDTGYGVKSFTMITKPQLYFVMMRSRAQVARRFRQWIINEVLPALEEHGHYEIVKRNKENELTDKETQLIKDFLYRMTNFVGYTQSYINACWYAIRQATGVKSPAKFKHTDIPIITEELKRICFITECYNNARREAEEALFKKIIRKKGSFKELTDILGTMVIRSVDDSDLAKIQKLDRRNVDQDIQKLQQQIGA